MNDLNTLRLPRYFSPQDTCHQATYVGPISYWRGQKAIARQLVAVQFDDPRQYMSHGWHIFNASDWKVPETRPLYQALVSAIEARSNCMQTKNQKWFCIWTDSIMGWMKEHMPSGSGFDNGTFIDIDSSSENKLVLMVDFHHMDENGTYDGWTNHQVVVTPSLSHGFNVRVTGPNRNDIKAYIVDVISEALFKQVNPHEYQPS